MKCVNIKFKKIVVSALSALALTSALRSPATADIYSSTIPSNTPKYINGNPDAPLYWLEVGLKTKAEVECVNLKVVGICPDGEPLWSFRLPVQMIENVRNVGETMLELPIINSVQYANYEFFYNDIEDYVRGKTSQPISSISIGPNQRRRSGLTPEANQGLSFGQSHLYSLPNEFKPLILEFLPGACTSWPQYEPFKTDVYPNQMLWRVPEFTALAMPGAHEVSPMDCAAYDMATGKTAPGLIDLDGSSIIGSALGAATCASAWGGKVYPLDGHSYHPNPFVGDALRSLKAIHLGQFANLLPQYDGAKTHKFDKKKDAFKDVYNDSGCIEYGEKDTGYGSDFPRQSINEEMITHYVHWQTNYCCF